MFTFTFTWLRIVGLVQVRFMQYFAKKEKSAVPTNKRLSISAKAGFRTKSVRNPLQFALSVYFTIWMIYPILWLLVEGKIITPTISHCCTVVMDVLAKSMYGFALLKFQLLIDKSQVHFTELKVTKAELMEEQMEEKKKMRKILQQMDQDELDAHAAVEDEFDDDYEYKQAVHGSALENAPSVAGSDLGSKKKKNRRQGSRDGSLQPPSPRTGGMFPMQSMDNVSGTGMMSMPPMGMMNTMPQMSPNFLPQDFQGMSMPARPSPRGDSPGQGPKTMR